MEIKNQPSINEDEKVNVNRNQIEHRATWMGLSYEAAKQSGSDLEQTLRSAVSQTGTLHGDRIKANISEPFDMIKFTDAFLNEVGIKTFEMEFTEKTEDTLEISFHYCPLVAGWLKAGIPVEDIPLLCDIAMDGDRNIASAAGVRFSLGKTIAAGDDVCEVNFYRNT